MNLVGDESWSMNKRMNGQIKRRLVQQKESVFINVINSLIR